MADGGKIRIIRVRPEKEPDVVFIDNTLEGLQTVVGGYVEQIPPGLMLIPLPAALAIPGLMLLADEDGLAKRLPHNRFVLGTFIFTKHDGEGNNISLSDEDLDKLREALNA